MARMEIFPAIDLQSGACVRLRRGDMDAPRVYGPDPAAVASSFKRAGANWVHVVDLDAAASGFGANRSAIEAILKAGLKTQVGGGIRSLDHVQVLRAMGAARIVVGTAAVEDEALLGQLVTACGDALAVAVDARGEHVAVRGWKETSPVLIDELLDRLKARGVTRIIYTDIDRDGMLAGPNLERLAKVCRDYSFGVIASGGVATLDDVAALAQMPLEGAIIGKALYEGQIDLAEALRVAK